jgi:general secretion pathway protein D
MAKADGYIRDLETLVGADDPSAARLRAEYAARRADPTFQNIDELSPGFRQKTDRVQELLVRGRARYLYGDYQGAIEAYREVLQFQPNNPEAKAYQVRIRELLSETSGQWNRGVTKGKLLELLDETWKLPEVFNREVTDKGGAQVTDPVTERLKSITLPQVRIVDQPLDRACQYLSQQAQQYDKDQRELNIVPVDPERKNPPISIAIGGVTVEQALNIITRQVGFTWIVNQGIVEVRPDSGSSDLETEFFPLSTSAVIKMTGVSAGGSAAAPGATASPFGGAGGGSAAGAESRPEEVGIKNFFIRSGVTFEGVTGSALAYDGTNLIVTQNRKNLDRVRNILRRYSDIKQVHIESKFIEVSQSSLNELITNWQLLTAGNAIRAQTELRALTGVFGVSAAGRNGLIDRGAGTTPLTINNTPPNIAGANYGTGLSSFGGSGTALSLGTAFGVVGNVGTIDSYNLNMFLRAVEQNSGTDLMSSPSLTVLDGKTAIIKVAQLLRYPQSYGDVQAVVSAGTTAGAGGNSVAITAGTPQDFAIQEVGVTLEVTPTVAADDSIALNLKPRVIEFEGFVEYGGTSVAISGTTTVSVPSGFFQPIFTTREVSTDVTVFDGATVVIGGLTREEIKSVEDKVPVLGDIPLIGAAFRSSGKTANKRNLMVFVTANLVSPGGATLRSSHTGMRAGTTFSNPVLASPGGAVYREVIEPAPPAPPAPGAPIAPAAPAAPAAN